jgi:tRNA 5-methylaminomethyl-2-thiouridine biosynthesis bifunctional protein
MQDIFEPGAAERRSAEAVADLLGEPALAGGLELTGARVVDPARVLDAWLASDLVAGEVIGLERMECGWQVLMRGAPPITAQTVVIAAGWAAAKLLPSLNLSPVRGQASMARGARCGMASAFGGYAIPTRDGVLFGATHDRGRTDAVVDAADHERNFKTLAAHRPALAAALTAAEVTGRASIRATTRDRMPSAGEVESGLHVLCGLGSRGFTTAPLLAEHVVAQCLGVPSPLARDLAALTDPRRPSA